MNPPTCHGTPLSERAARFAVRVQQHIRRRAVQREDPVLPVVLAAVPCATCGAWHLVKRYPPVWHGA